MCACAVLHVTSLLGGGVDRHVRDIVRATRGPHLVWHVGDAAEIMEVPADERLFPLDRLRVETEPGTVSRWLVSKNVGVIHVHALDAETRERAVRARQSTGAGLVATLHDVLFLSPRAFEASGNVEPDPAWLDANANFLRTADAIVAPSEYIADLARRHIPGINVTVVPNGSGSRKPASAQARPEFAQHRPRHVVAVLGALGPHKGADMVDALASELEETGIGIVVIGYMDRQVVPGWRVPGTLFIHGSWQDDQVASLVAAYGACIALFPNRAPESFSYTLSDAWSCGLPVLSAPGGALGERISRHGGGWLLPAGFDARAIAARLAELFSPQGAEERARVESQLARHDPDRVPSLASMARSLDALYARFGVDAPRPQDGDPAAIERLLAVNLDGSLFRAELARLADEYVQLGRALEEANDGARRFEAESREWIAKLERDIASLTADVQREVAERRALGEQNAQLAVHKAAFDRLPEIVRRWYLKKARDARS